MKALRLLLLFLILVSTEGCQKGIASEGEKTAQSVQAVISENNIKLANVFVGSTQQLYGLVFSIEGQFLVFTDSYGYKQYYNFSKLIRFNTGRNVSNGPIILQLYF